MSYEKKNLKIKNYAKKHVYRLILSSVGPKIAENTSVHVQLMLFCFVTFAIFSAKGELVELPKTLLKSKKTSLGLSSGGRQRQSIASRADDGNASRERA